MSPELLKKLNGSAKTLGVASVGGLLGAAIPIVLWLLGVAKAEGVDAQRLVDVESSAKVHTVQIESLGQEDKSIRQKLNDHEKEGASKDADLRNAIELLKEIRQDLKNHMAKER